MGQAARARREGARARRDVGRTYWFCFLEAPILSCLVGVFLTTLIPSHFGLTNGIQMLFFFFFREGVGVVGAEVFGVFREVSERSSLTQGKHGFAP